MGRHAKLRGRAVLILLTDIMIYGSVVLVLLKGAMT